MIAPFARANYYRAAAAMLRDFAERCESELGFSRGDVRIFTNSRIPEKPLLAASGLGAMGKNGLCIVPGLGSLFVIAGVVLPIPFAALGDQDVPVQRAAAQDGAPAQDGASARQAALAPADPCGSCDRCLRACPVGALTAPGVLDTRRCLQAMATSRQPFDDETQERWGTRLYGCQGCQACCPHNSRLSVTARAATGELGPSVSLVPLLSMEDTARRRMFHGTALGMSWIPPESLLRNALVAAGNRGDPAARTAVAAHVRADDPAVRHAARRALERLSAVTPGGSP